MYRLAGVEAHVDSSSEQHKAALRELESSELGAKVVAVTRAEVLEEVRVHGAAVDEDGLDLVAGVGDLHPRDHEAVHLGAHAVQVDLHVEGGAGLHTQLVVNEGSVLANTHAQDGDGAVTGHLLDALDIVNSPVNIIVNILTMINRKHLSSSLQLYHDDAK